ncbi:hypothetical protein D9611_010470 [Ephemerocybe angulata]|uniref:Oligopeptide transporter n=1 Tax=Ephemerocybe angulata TaxID=980116 RepID=A0A8H5BWY4_9AGAR|nr:hypothetical protein D9611_010470 [Tulosesus angulatus]
MSAQPTLEREKTSGSSDIDEKKVHAHDTSVEEQPEEEYEDEAYEGNDVSKPFPIDPHAPEETHQLTVRAVVVGCGLGAVVGASNIYLGLKTGFTFGPQLFGAIFGFAILKPLSKIIPESGIVGKVLGGGPFGPKENCTVQTAATAAGGLGILFVSAVPAMYNMNLLSRNPADDIGRLIGLTFCAAFFGVFFVIPLRRYYIINQKLTFPTPAATAYTIRQLHRGRHGAVVAHKKAMALVYSFAATFCFKIMTGYAPGIIYDWHIGWTLYRLGFTGAIALENYNWVLEFTPAFFGAGMLSGLNASWSFLGGSVLAWGIIAPSIVKTGKAVLKPIDPEEFPGWASVMAMVYKDPEQYITGPSPRYWLLWPGVFIMLVYSFADIFISLIPSFGSLTLRKSDFDPRGWFTRTLQDDDEDRTPLEDRVPHTWWIGGLLVSTVACCAILSKLFHMNVGTSILALVLGFIFSFIAVQSSGHTDVNPVSTVAKASQLVFGGVSKGVGMEIKAAQTLNLAAGVIAAGSAAQSSDMTGDLKTGYLLGSKPRAQFIAQCAGAVVAVFLSCGLFILFTKASPCIIYPDEYDGICTYGAPSVAAWVAVATAVTAPKLPIPPSSGYTAIGLGIASVITVLIKHFLVPKKYWGYVPNWNAIGLAFVVPQVWYSIAMGFGSVFNAIWLKKNPKSFDMYMFAISAGLLAGEGLGGVLQAILAIAKVDGQIYGTAIGCPGLEYCG